MRTIYLPSDKELKTQKLWIEQETKDIGEKIIAELIQRAIKQREFAYSPYSQYKVGVAILTHDGKIFTGANAERVTYTQTDHAEQAAITNAVNVGAALKNRKFLRALAVVHEHDSAPCGHCRQIILEHCDNCLIIVADPKEKIRYVTSMKILLPLEFTPSTFGK